MLTLKQVTMSEPIEIDSQRSENGWTRQAIMVSMVEYQRKREHAEHDLLIAKTALKHLEAEWATLPPLRRK